MSYNFIDLFVISYHIWCKTLHEMAHLANLRIINNIYILSFNLSAKKGRYKKNWKNKRRLLWISQTHTTLFSRKWKLKERSWKRLLLWFCLIFDLWWNSKHHHCRSSLVFWTYLLAWFVFACSSFTRNWNCLSGRSKNFKKNTFAKDRSWSRRRTSWRENWNWNCRSSKTLFRLTRNSESCREQNSMRTKTLGN